MRYRTTYLSVITLSLFAILFLATGQQGTLPLPGMTMKDIQSWLLNMQSPPISSQASKAFVAMSPAQRTAAVRQLGGVVKTIAGSDAFQKAYAEHIKSSYHAVNHGYKEPPPPAAGNVADLEKRMGDVQRQAAIAMAMQYRNFPVEMLRGVYQEQLKNWAETLKDSDTDPAERARLQKIVPRAKAIGPLAQSNPEAFKKEFSLLMSASMGGPDTEAGLTSSNAASESQNQVRMEQQAWDQHNFKSVFKRKLTEFIALASSVDFNAQTRDVKGTKVFVNPAYERKSFDWKLLYRAGREPTTAALEIAQALVKEY